MNLLIRKNESSQTKLAYPVRVADSYLSRLKGLMFKKYIKEGLVLRVPKSKSSTRSAIHTSFMLISIDVLFVNEDNIIHDMVSIKPWNVYKPNGPSKYVIEIENGLINKHKIAIGDEIHFEGSLKSILTVII